MNRRYTAILFVIATTTAQAAWPWGGGPQVGTLTAVQGTVKVFSHPSKDKVLGPPPHAKFEGLYYSVKDGVAGDSIDRGNIVRTQPGAKARVIFANGDQFLVGPASSYRISWNKDTSTAKTDIELRYGKARFVIEKGGPRSRLKIRTRAAVMGVRGTDFFVAVNEQSGATETATLRGSVSVETPAGPASAQPAVVEAGQTASAAQTTTAASESPAIAVHKTTQEELQAVQRNSTVQPTQPTPPEVAEKIQKLEEQAIKTTVEDIRAADPQLAEKLDAAKAAGQTANLDELNQATVAKLAAVAPTDSSSGPISDMSIEKGNVTEQKADLPDAEEPAPLLPRYWLGVRFGGSNSSISPSNNNGGCSTSGGNTCYSTSYNPLNGGFVGVAGELEAGRNFWLFGEFYPAVRHGTRVQASSSGSGNSGGYSYDLQYKIDTLDLALGTKPTLPFGRRRIIALHAVLAMRLSLKKSAQLDGGGSGSSDLSNNTKGFMPALELGGGLDVRAWHNIKLSFELRATQGIGDAIFGGQNLPSGVSSINGPLQDFFFTFGASYGFL